MAALKERPKDGTSAQGGGGGRGETGRVHARPHPRARDRPSDGPVIGRDVEVRRLLQILERRYKNHPLLVGEPGVGKTAIVGALAARIAAGDVPETSPSSRCSARDRRTHRRGEAPRRGRGAAQADARGRPHDGARATPSSTSRSRRALRPGAPGAGSGTCSSRCSRAGTCACSHRRRPRGCEDPGEGPVFLRRFSVLTIDAATPIRRSRSCAASRRATRRTIACRSATPPSRRQCASPSAISQIARSPTARSTSWTRPRPASAWSSTASPPSSTSPSSASPRSRRSAPRSSTTWTR